MYAIEEYNEHHARGVDIIFSAVMSTSSHITQESRKLLLPQFPLPFLHDGVRAWVALYADMVVGYTAIGGPMHRQRSVTAVIPSMQGKGVGKALLRYKRDTMEPFFTHIGATNGASVKVALDIGMTLVGIISDKNHRVILVFKSKGD